MILKEGKTYQYSGTFVADEILHGMDTAGWSMCGGKATVTEVLEPIKVGNVIRSREGCIYLVVGPYNVIVIGNSSWPIGERIGFDLTKNNTDEERPKWEVIPL